MPKVETLLDFRGENQITPTIDLNYVSNTIGKLLSNNQKLYRNKRDLISISTARPHKRVVKKLIRIEPIYNVSLKNHDHEDINYYRDDDYNHLKTNTEANIRKHKRRRLLVKKKKKRKLVSQENTISSSEELLPKPRRKVIITRKRLLKSDAPTTTSVTIASSSITKILPNLEEPDDSSEEYNNYDEDSNNQTLEDTTEDNPPQNLPDYEPFFPELSESLDAPVLLLKTTVLSTVNFLTKTIVQSRLRTYTFVVTRVNGDEKVVTSTTEVKPQIKTNTVTESHTQFTTLTLLDLDASSTLPPIPNTIIPTLDNPELDNKGRGYEEARYNLATRVMSNGVEVIVAGDKSTLPGEPDVKRVLPSTIYKPVTLRPSTLSDHMLMIDPQPSDIDSLSSDLLYPNQFVTKTCLTTFTYLTTFLEGSTTTVSSHEQVVSNIATEERNTGKILPTPAMGITLTQYPNLSVGVFHTTYTYLNTILDGEQPLVVSSKHTVTNTVTAPDDYLSLLQPSETFSPLKDTNTYYSTVTLEKTLYEGQDASVVSTNEVVTQVVITESVPPKATSVMTSYIALDIEDPDPVSLSELRTTDVVKTYFVTYTYHNTMLENGKTVVRTNVSTSSDVVTEKLYLHPRKTKTSLGLSTPSKVVDDKKKHKIDLSGENFHILATKSYFTTFTYFTTLLQEDNTATPTAISSHTKVIENVVTETLDPNLFDKKYYKLLKNEIKQGSDRIIKLATLHDGQKIEITAVPNEVKDKIKPTKVLPIEKTKMPETTFKNKKVSIDSTPSVITGSTIVFVDDDPFAPKTTPVLKPKATKIKNNLGSILSSEIIKKSKTVVSSTKTKRPPKTKPKTQSNAITPTKVTNSQNTKQNDIKKKPAVSNLKVTKPAVSSASDLLGLGSINMNTIHALTPVLNAMAGLIQTNLKSNRRNDAVIQNQTTTTTIAPEVKREDITPNNLTIPAVDVQNRSPIYIPVGGLADDFEIAESQNIATFHLQETIEYPNKDQVVLGKPTHETSLLNGGISISPGEVITANSDVIVGKPGRIGPRIPSSIPLNQAKEDEIPIGMKPPPVPNNGNNKHHPKRNHEYKHIPVRNVVHAPNKDDYVGAPPPPPTPKENKRNDYRHIPLNSPHDQSRFSNQIVSQNYNFRDNEIKLNIPVNDQIYAQGQQNYGAVYQLNEVNHEANIANLKEAIQKNYDTASKESIPIYADGQASMIVPSISFGPLVLNNDFHIQPSILNEPIVLPEIIERSTGQPLLVNLQPSQVAFINIPYNRTTALIYGGSTEPHKNGQYFDDPSPYPQPEFSAIENYKNGQPQFASIYHDQDVNQKQVNGVIKVDNQVINIEPSTSSNNNIPLTIKPSKPNANEVLLRFENQEVNVNVPPISFGMVQQGSDFNAHIINHSNNLQLKPPPISYEVQNNVKDTRFNEHLNYQSQFKVPPPSNQFGNQFQTNENANQIVFPAQKNAPNQFTAQNTQNVPNQFNNAQSSQNVPNHFDAQNAPNQFNSQSSNQISFNTNHNAPSPNNQNVYGVEEIVDLKPPSDNKQFPNQNKSKYVPKRNFRPRPPQPDQKPPQISEFMTPPPVQRFSTVSKRPNTTRRKNPVPIPITPESVNTNNPLVHYNIAQSIEKPYYNVHSNVKDADAYGGGDLDIGDDSNEDLINEDGEVIQESNSRPLRPGQIPFEILKANKVKTTTEQVLISNQTISYPTYQIAQDFQTNPKPFDNALNSNSYIPRPIFNNSHNLVIRPENQLSNQVNYFSSTTNQLNNNIFGNKLPSVTTERVVVTFKPQTRAPVTRSTTTRRPITLLSINKNVFAHKPQRVTPTKNNRPRVTSLPIDTQTLKPKIDDFRVNLNTQTEAPFSVVKDNNSLHKISNQIDIKPEATTTRSTPELNTGEVPFNLKNNSIRLSDMEVMQPPPLFPDKNPNPVLPIKPPGEVILKVPPRATTTDRSQDLEAHASSTQAVPSAEMIPPPEILPNTEVVGLSPPPLVSTSVPITKLETTTENSYKYTVRTRKPFTRRPGYRRTTTPPSTTTTIRNIVNRRKPVQQIYNSINRKPSTFANRITVEETTSSPVKVNTPTMQVIIGNPNFKEDNKERTTTSKYYEPHNNMVDLLSSEIAIKESSNEQTNLLNIQPTRILESSTANIESKTSSSKTNIRTHHAGNEIKISDELTPDHKSSTTLVRKPAPSIKESKPVLPTRYITHTKTSTVTITKTTVVKTLGGPPSTLTLLVTKTEKSTIIDTVTEFHTLVKPTSIVETITTTVNHGSSLYPANVYGSTYPSIQIRPTTVVHPHHEPTTIVHEFIQNSNEDDSLEEFIINETDAPETLQQAEDSNESIFVVMTDKNHGSIVKVPNVSHETQERDEMLANNEVNNVMLGGILLANQPSLNQDYSSVSSIGTTKCKPECRASRNELCQKVEGIMRCVCRPGFARMFPDRPCNPTYTYSLKVNLDRHGKNNLSYNERLTNPNSGEFLRLRSVVHEAIDRMVMQSDLRDVYHGVYINSFEPPNVPGSGVTNRFYLQLSDNIDEHRLEDVFKKYLRNNNYSLGGTDVFASPHSLDTLKALDFDECVHPKFHDCSENSQCFNLKGTYTCSCKEGFSDLSENMLYPGRICSAELIGCERCNYHGTCYSRGDEQVFCECFQWYTGESCLINLKVLLIALVTLGTILFALLLVCIILTCARKKPRKAGLATGINFLPQRVSNSGNRNTMDRRAMIQDSSSEDSRSESNTLPYVAKQPTRSKPKPKGALKKTPKSSMQHSVLTLDPSESCRTFPDQKDRSLTVMIPRAKYHPAPPTSPLMNYTTFDAKKPSVPSTNNNEAKLLSYLDAGPMPSKSEPRRKYSNNTASESYIEEKPSSRKTSGALISAGFEVSATVINNMGTLGTTCGTEADRSENATLIQKISADLLSSTGTRSQFNTLRKSLVDNDMDPMSSWMEITPRVNTISEARSYDETTIPPPMKSFRTDYDSKPSSQHPNDEANTMAERDLGSTFLLPHTHLYKPDRGSDISGFESL